MSRQQNRVRGGPPRLRNGDSIGADFVDLAVSRQKKQRQIVDQHKTKQKITQPGENNRHKSMEALRSHVAQHYIKKVILTLPRVNSDGFFAFVQCEILGEEIIHTSCEPWERWRHRT